MRKIYTKRPRKYNPVRICNPQDMHTARLHPRQGLNIVLDNPNSWENVKDAHYDVHTTSPYITLDSVGQNAKGQTVFSFIQKYDLTNWSEVSELYLGEVCILLEGNTHEKKDECKYIGSTIGVYHQPHSTYQCNILTTVNPSGKIKLEPHRTLEVICYEPDWAEEYECEEWKVHIEDFEVECEGVFLEEVKKHWFTTRVIGNDKSKSGEFTVLPRYCPNINPLLEEKERATWASELDRKNRPGRQYHFWFSFTKASIKKISALKTGDYVAARLTLKGSAKTRHGTCVNAKREFILMLSKHGKPVATGTGDGMFNHRTALTCIGNSGTRREFDRYRNLLTNPGQTEQLDFCTGFEECIVEVAQPKVYWEGEPEGAQWLLERDNGQAGECLDITHLANVERSGIKYQRFKVTRKTGAVGVQSGSSSFLGAIKVVYAPKLHLHEGSKRISVWMNYKKSASIYSPQGGCHQTSTCRTGFVHYKNGLGHYEGPKIAILKMEEIACVSLAEGEKTKKLKDVYTYSGSEWEDYYYGVPPPTQQQQSKKKDGSERIPPSHILGNPPENRSSSGRSGVEGEHTTTQTTTQTGTGSTEPIVLLNPTHLYEVALQPEQEVIIRLMPPEDVLTRQEDREKCRGELWTVNPMAVADVRPIVVRHRITPAGTERYRQEIVVKADSHRLPQHKGNHCMGAIRLECSATNRVVRIHVKKDMQTERVYRVPHDINFLKDMPVHEANNHRYFLAQNWKHGDGVFLKKTDILYVRQPDDEDMDWKDSEWTIRFIQHPIPPELWERMPNEVRNIVDRQRPWYSKDHPIFMNKTVMFKSLDQSSCSAMPKLLEELARMVPGNYFPMATIVFESEKWQEQEDEIGVIETLVKLRREFQICTALEKPKQKKAHFFPIYHPVDGAEVKVEVGDVLSFHLSPTEAEVGGYYAWQVISFPTFLQEAGSDKVGGDDNFKFRVVRGDVENFIRFKAGKEIRAVKVIVKEK